MRKTLLFALAALGAGQANSQAIITSWTMNTNGLATYDLGSGTVTMSDSSDVLEVCYDNNYVYVRSEGLAGYEMGPFPSNPNTPTAQDFVWRITRNPVEETGTKTAEPTVGALGVAVNGVALYGKGDARSYDPMSNSNSGMGAGIWNADAWVSEGSTMDANGNGHPQQQGQYHYHANPSALYSDPSTAHSPIIGWAMDGFPIYGPFGYSDPNDNTSQIKRMECGYEQRMISTRTTLPDGSTSTPPGPPVSTQFPIGTYWEDYEYVGNADLDEYNGRQCVTPEFPGGTYAYFLSTDSNGDPKFPYMIGLEYYGVISTMDLQGAGNSNVPGSATCSTNGFNSIAQLSQANMTMYPNPTQGHIYFDLDLENGEVIVLNSAGAIVAQASLSNTSSLDISHLTNGIYMVQVKDTKGNFVAQDKLIISK